MEKALVVLSGGQDSATCAAWAKEKFGSIECISFNYKQRHSKELDSAKKIADLFSAPHDVYEIPVLAGNKTSGLTSDTQSVLDTDTDTGLPKSFVPGRNLIFLTSAASIAISRGIKNIVTGVCQTDYSGYPDCRDETIKALNVAINLGNAKAVEIHTPLMFLTKSETVELAKSLPLGMDAVALSWTCYQGGEKPCMACPSCVLRIKGFQEASVLDPALS